MKRLAMMAALTALAVPAALAGQSGGAAPPTERGQLILFDQTNYGGEDMAIDGLRRELRWDHHPRSIAVHPGDRWDICARPRFAECITLDRSVSDVERIGLRAGRRIGSVRPAQRLIRAATPNPAPAQPQRQPGM